MTGNETIAAAIPASRASRVREVDVASVRGNKTLSAGVDRRAVERCKDAIGKIGVLHTPVIGAAEDGRIVLSGQCEFMALRELGARKMDVIEIDAEGGGAEAAKLSLWLATLQNAPGALCEGLLIKEAIMRGVGRSEIQAMTGKSASWVSNRLSLVTRLDGGVYEMVESGLLDSRSAQEVARLPHDLQFGFAEAAVREGLPKSAIESLVAGYNDGDCPDAVKAQILSDPRTALLRMSDGRRAVGTDLTKRRGEFRHENQPPSDIGLCIKATIQHMAVLCRMLFGQSPYSVNTHIRAIKELECELLALLSMLRGLVSPGKTEVSLDAD